MVAQLVPRSHREPTDVMAVPSLHTVLLGVTEDGAVRGRLTGQCRRKL